jgi:hypothetical protein
MSLLPTDSTARKGIPVCTGCLDYFADALCEVAYVSVAGNKKHNPGQPLHWSKGKSNDHADALLRHLIDRGKWDEIDIGNGEKVKVRHSAEVAWRALSLLQTELEDERVRQDAGKLIVSHPGKIIPYPQEPRDGR